MHQKHILLLALLFFIFTGCEDKKPKQSTIPVENTTVIVTEEKEESNIQNTEETKEFSHSIPLTVEAEEETNIEAEKAQTKPEKNVSDTVTLLDTQKGEYTAKVTHESLIFQNNTKPIVIVQLFATWCTPCIGEIAYLNDLQETYKEDIFVAGLLTRDEIDTATLNTFIEEHHINYKLLRSEDDNTLGTTIAQGLDIQGTFPIPLIVIYLNGKYYTHYEGSVPVEMIKYDIKQAQQQLKKNEDQR